MKLCLKSSGSWVPTTAVLFNQIASFIDWNNFGFMYHSYRYRNCILYSCNNNIVVFNTLINILIEKIFWFCVFVKAALESPNAAFQAVRFWEQRFLKLCLPCEPWSGHSLWSLAWALLWRDIRWPNLVPRASQLPQDQVRRIDLQWIEGFKVSDAIIRHNSARGCKQWNSL